MRRGIGGVVLLIVAIGIAYTLGMVGPATDSIQFDLTQIGKSIYEARSRTGHWPKTISDLEGTTYLRMPYRRKLLEDKHFVIVWPDGLDPAPAANRDRILAYDNGSLFSRLGRIWVCRGDLSLERLSAEELTASIKPIKP